MKKCINIIIAILLIFIILIFNSSVQANSTSWSDIDSKAGGFINRGSQNTVIDNNKVGEAAANIGSILVGIASGVFVICAIVMGIKYMTTSPDGKGKLKQQAIGLVVAIVVTYGAVGIWQLIINFMNSIVD